jgi:hypothetical protein
MGSYVDLVLDRSELNTAQEHQVQLGEKLRQALAPLRAQAQLEVCVRRCLFHPQERWGYSLTLFTHAYGADAGEAAREWARTLEAQGEALARIDATFRQLLADPSDPSPSP